MFGNIFNQKKTTDDKHQPQTTPAADPAATPQTPGATPTDPAATSTTETPEAVTPQDPSASELQPQTPSASGDPAAAATTLDGQVQPGATPADPSHPGAGPTTNPAVGKDDMSALTHLDPRTSQVLTKAQEEARRIHQQYIDPEQLLLGLLYDEQIFKFLADTSVDGGALSKEIQAKEKMGTYKGQPTLSDITKQAFDQGYKDAKLRGANFIAPEDLFVVLFDPKYHVTPYLDARGLKKEAVIDKLSKSTNSTYGKKTVLEKYGIDLTEEARAGRLDPVAGRDKEIDRIVHILLRRTKNNPIIIGEPGVGKTAIAEGLAEKIVAGQVPKDLQEKRIFQLDIASLIAGASHRGEFEERLRAVINEVLASENRIILFVDEIHALMGTGEGEGMNAANIIKPHLARGHFQLIGATTNIEYRKNFEKDKAFERRFQPVQAEEPSEENAIEMLKVLRPKYEKFHHVTISDETLKQCVKLSKKYIGERYLPDKAVDLLDEACSHVKLEVDRGKRGETNVKKSDIEQVVSAWTGIPITKLTEDESEKLLKLEDRIHQRLIDQEEAVVAVSEAVRRGRIGLAPANRPIASFVFLGPTGVGKTELAKTLAELLFGKDDAMVRLDMSEYMEKHEVAKLIGAPPGYVGYEEGGQLTEAVRKKPYSIVLFDEIEKAHPDVFNILLQLLEDGRLTDNKGNTISFKNTIVICTSNIGSALIQQQLTQMDPNVKPSPEAKEKSWKELQKVVKEELIKFFRPELLNRFDEVVIFKPLAAEHMMGIARLSIAKTAKLLKEQGFNLQITEKAVAQLAKNGYDPAYGARPLRRLIQTAIENQIALAIISKKFVVGDTITIDFNDATNEFVFEKDGNSQIDTTPFVKKAVLNLLHPENVVVPDKRDSLTKLHEKLEQQSQIGNALAAEIMTITETSNVPAITKLMEDLRKGRDQDDELATEILTMINSEVAEAVADAKPSTKVRGAFQKMLTALTLTKPEEKAKFTKIYDKISQANKENHPLAAELMAITNTTSDGDIMALKEKLEKAKQEGDPLAAEILAAIDETVKEEESSKADASDEKKTDETNGEKQADDNAKPEATAGEKPAETQASSPTVPGTAQPSDSLNSPLRPVQSDPASPTDMQSLGASASTTSSQVPTTEMPPTGAQPQSSIFGQPSPNLPITPPPADGGAAVGSDGTALQPGR